MKYICYLGLLVLFSCQGSMEPKSNIISERVFTDIIKDIHLNEAEFENYKRTDFEKYKLYQSENYNLVFLKYKITNKDFEESMSYYIREPEKLEKIYSIAIEELQEIKAANLQ